MEKNAKTIWGKQETTLFIECCVEERRKQSKGSFKRVGWSRIEIQFNNRNNSSLDYSQLKNKWDSLKKDWNAWRRLGNLIGIGWDPDKKTYTGTDEWWKQQIEEIGKEVKKFRDAPLICAEQLDYLFGNITSPGSNSYTPSSGVLPQSLRLDHEEDVEVEKNINTQPEAITSFTELLNRSYVPPACGTPTEHISASSTVPQNMNMPIEVGTNPIGKKRKSSNEIGDVASLTENITRLVDVMEARNIRHHSSMSSISQKNRAPSILEVMNLILELPDVTNVDDIYIEAADVMKSSINREMFVALNGGFARKTWLKNEISKEKKRQEKELQYCAPYVFNVGHK